MSVQEIIDEANQQFEAALAELPQVSADELGLDRRAGRLYVDVDHGLIISSNTRTLDYYGGFEYVHEDAVQVFGKYKIYSDEDERVADAIAKFRQKEEL